MKCLLVVITTTVLCIGGTCWALKCQTDDGVTEEDVRRIVRVCMRKVGEDDSKNASGGGGGGGYSNESDDDYEDEASDEPTDDYDRGQRSRQHSNAEDSYNRQHRNRDRDHLRGSQGFRGPTQYGDYSYSAPSGGGGGGGGSGYGGRGGGGYDNNSRTRSSGSDSNRTISVTEKQAERDRACIVHCFFQEMKMTGDRHLPDKHKVIQVITKDLRDRQLKEFYVNSIQECFYILEFNHPRQPEKCEFSTRLLQCLGERARTNCDDWQDNRTVIF